MLRRVTEVPNVTHTGGRQSYVEQDIRQFARNQTMDMAELTYEGKRASNISVAVRKYLDKHPDVCKGIVVAKRGEHVYLIKENYLDK